VLSNRAIPSLDMELREAVAGVNPDYLNVRTIDLAVCVEILPEVSARYGLVKLTLNKPLISWGDSPVSIGVPGKEAKRNVSMWQPVAVHVLHVQGDNLRNCNSRKWDCYAITAERECSHRGGAAHDTHLAGSNRLVEGEHSIVSSGTAVFHS
jgi:hypothetical protein